MSTSTESATQDLSDNIIEIKNLTYSYPAYKEGEVAPKIFDNLNLTVKKGEFVSIMGPTGAGKTTLCLALNGIIPHVCGGKFIGDILINGMNTKEVTISEIAKVLGIVFQDPESQLFCMTIADEVAFGMENQGVPTDIMHQKVQEVLKEVGMTGRDDTNPFHLSGGQKQRVAIASILSMEPSILILDEPTSGLDPIGKKEVFSVVDRLKRERNMTILMIEQESERIAEFSDRVILLNNGHIVADGTPREIFANEEGLRECGISTPQVSEIALRYNEVNGTNHRFITMDEALDVLKK